MCSFSAARSYISFGTAFLAATTMESAWTHKRGIGRSEPVALSNFGAFPPSLFQHKTGTIVPKWGQKEVMSHTNCASVWRSVMNRRRDGVANSFVAKSQGPSLGLSVQSFKGAPCLAMTNGLSATFCWQVPISGRFLISSLY